ncbi:TetR/AcrR family transcriptional regulator [Arthrobacter sp. CDRTa11]|uniref:TetR/AcrR family transcriptional regulator n=1 Tax=Arthrobacter sp. CDRTa11 TaxID=2651199 RepID=UPI002265D747|nr:TetR/AcrR family transcriptional regulator [Arthrobacter sp. CDRTa11]UZX03225.1 TetR/AcrR family transcriptional regulator [Arthrobacter sp. CDRTa11]
MSLSASPLGRRERSKQDKKERIRAAAGELFALHDVGTVTTQQIADRADIAIGTLYLYAATKAELLIMVQNQKFATAIDDGLSAAAAVKGRLDAVLALLHPVVICVLEHVENGRFYLNELVSGDPTEPYRREGLTLAARLEDGLRALLGRDGRIRAGDARMLARVITAVLHLSITGTVNRDRAVDDVMADIQGQIRAVLGQSPPQG